MLRIKVSLQNVRGCQVVEVAMPLAAAFTPGDTQGEAGIPGGLRAAALVPEFYREGRLGTDGGSQPGSTATLEGELVFVIPLSTDDDAPSVIFGSQGRNGSRVNWAREVLEHNQRVGNRASAIADGNTETFFSRVDGQDTHRR